MRVLINLGAKDLDITNAVDEMFKYIDCGGDHCAIGALIKADTNLIINNIHPKTSNKSTASSKPPAPTNQGSFLSGNASSSNKESERKPSVNTQDSTGSKTALLQNILEQKNTSQSSPTRPKKFHTKETKASWD